LRRNFIAGNWKMNLCRAEAIELAQKIVDGMAAHQGLDVAVCPPAVYLSAVADVTGRSSLGLGAQNMFFEADGPFTGEQSAAMLTDVGCQYVILGHSERRLIFGETDADVHRKVQAAFAAGLIPIVCVGETLEQREAGETAGVISRQFQGSLAGHPVDQMPRLVVAYEPIWAIGTGRVATPQQAEEVHAHLRELLKNGYNSEIADAVRIQYGGSVKPGNATELLSQPNIDGALVGGASLAADSFLAILAAA
jgi:triosephosphate isomerase